MAYLLIYGVILKNIFILYFDSFSSPHKKKTKKKNSLFEVKK